MVVVRFAGYGGQGLLTAGLILADAAGMYDKKKVVQTQSYGAEARGGASRSDVIVSDEDIVFPKPDHLDVLVAMNQLSVDKYSSALSEGGTLIADATFVTTVTFTNAYLIPFTAVARDKIGREIVANVVALGALVELEKVVSKKAVTKALEQRIPPGALDINRKALEAGFKAGRACAAEREKAVEDFDIV
ncbi:MAG: 2-oxoacid:acceptor oxidoreductase family protein [Candidatus Zixiibacteriota bacterium]|jgi:2-oxoglutarate ferredoxin oxidoreductase subunit gamma